jgi:hypothetical protein
MGSTGHETPSIDPTKFRGKLKMTNTETNAKTSLQMTWPDRAAIKAIANTIATNFGAARQDVIGLASGAARISANYQSGQGATVVGQELVEYCKAIALESAELGVELTRAVWRVLSSDKAIEIYRAIFLSLAVVCCLAWAAVQGLWQRVGMPLVSRATDYFLQNLPPVRDRAYAPFIWVRDRIDAEFQSWLSLVTTMFTGL